MKKLTEEERRLLNALETCADRMNTLKAMLEIFGESCPFSNDHFSEEVRRRRCLRADHYILGISHLAAYYHDDAIRIAEEFDHTSHTGR